jgi:hypothetical protein
MRSVDEYRRCGQERSAGFVRTVLGLRKTFLGDRAARPPRSDSGASVQGVVSQGDHLFDEGKNIRRAVSQIAIGASQFADAIASSTAMKARAILVPHWVKAIGVARLDEFHD